MKRQRMPIAKYQRQINQMVQDWWQWKDVYTRSATECDNQYLAARLDERALQITDAIELLVEAAELIGDLPRTSL